MRHFPDAQQPGDECLHLLVHGIIDPFVRVAHIQHHVVQTVCRQREVAGQHDVLPLTLRVEERLLLTYAYGGGRRFPAVHELVRPPEVGQYEFQGGVVHVVSCRAPLLPLPFVVYLHVRVIRQGIDGLIAYEAELLSLAPCTALQPALLAHLRDALSVREVA